MSGKDYGTLEDFNRYLVYRRPEGLFTVPQGKKYVWFNPNPKDPDSYDTGEVQSDNGDEVSVDFDTGVITNVTKGETYQAEPFPPFIKDMIAKGGLMASLKAKEAAQ